MDKTRAFAEFETFYALFKPLTPYGRLYRENRPFFTDAAALKAEYDLTAAAGAFLAARREKGDRLRFHLRCIPRLDLAQQALCSAPGLFLARKFLANTSAIFKLLPAALRSKFGARWDSAELLTLLFVCHAVSLCKRGARILDANREILRNETLRYPRGPVREVSCRGDHSPEVSPSDE